MKLLDFDKHYPTEESCIIRFKEMRIKSGVVCPHCGHTEHLWLPTSMHFECKNCYHRQSLRSGTIMHSSKLPFMYWFKAIHLMTSTKKTFSALEIQRQLGHKRYEPIWEMMHKIRLAMGNRDDEYTLDGEVVPDLKAATITPIVETHVSSTSKIDSDNLTSYVKLNEIVEEHHHEVIDTRDIAIVLPWVHVAISNAKRLILSIFHDIKPAYLQLYLNEFCYKFNRRYFGENCFDRLLIACVKTNTDFRRLNG